MTDIVARLRALEKDQLEAACGDEHSVAYYHAEVCHRAADEIERLRAALTQISVGYENQNISHVDFRVKAKQTADGALRLTEQ